MCTANRKEAALDNKCMKNNITACRARSFTVVCIFKKGLEGEDDWEREGKGDDCRLLYRADNIGFSSLALSPFCMDLRDRLGSLAAWNKLNSAFFLLFSFSNEALGCPCFYSRRKVSAGERLNIRLFVYVSSQQWPQGSRLTWSHPVNESCHVPVASALGFQTPGRIVREWRGWRLAVLSASVNCVWGY